MQQNNKHTKLVLRHPKSNQMLQISLRMSSQVSPLGLQAWPEIVRVRAEACGPIGRAKPTTVHMNSYRVGLMPEANGLSDLKLYGLGMMIVYSQSLSQWIQGVNCPSYKAYRDHSICLSISVPYIYSSCGVTQLGNDVHMEWLLCIYPLWNDIHTEW